MIRRNSIYLVNIVLQLFGKLYSIDVVVKRLFFTGFMFTI